MTSAFAPAVEMLGINKRFGGVWANCNVDLTIYKGSIHGIVGENGAGKSTLMSILYGFYEADSGIIKLNGHEVRIKNSRDAIRHGIGMVHQHFMLIDPLNVVENVMLGNEGGLFLKNGARQVRQQLVQLGKDYGLSVDTEAKIADLPVGLQQRVEILKALIRGAEILILDEPTAVLTPTEADQLFEMLRLLRAQGKTILIITHKLREIMAVTDHVSVMRRGQMIVSLETGKTSAPELADAMVGRKVLLKVEKKPLEKFGAVLMKVRDLTVRDQNRSIRLDRVSFDLHAGEIVGIAGVSGNGQSELLEVLAGMIEPDEGTISFLGKTLGKKDRTPKKLRDLHIMHVPEDRHRSGLVMSFPAGESAMLGFENDHIYGANLLAPGLIDRDCRDKMEIYATRPIDPKLKSANFSGGNQQKIVLAREIERDPTLLLVGQPTRGVDIGAIEFIHKRLVELRDGGKAILLVSVELDEIMALSDRIIVLCGGKITGERRPEDTNERELGLLMAGVTDLHS